MALTLGFTSMDQATETALRAAFQDANSRLNGLFTLASSDAADYVVIDMDSMYGPMGWLRLHAAGKQVIGLTSAARTQADFRIGRPFDTDAMVEVLRQLAAREGVDPDAGTAAARVAEGPVADADPQGAVTAPEPEAQAGTEPAGGEPGAAAAKPAVVPLALKDPQPEPEHPDPAASAGIPADASAEISSDAGQQEADPGTEDTGVPAAQADPEPEPPAPPREPVFADWLKPGALSGRFRFRRGMAPELWIDADARQYHGPAQLKPLAPHFEGTVAETDFEPVEDEAWAAGSAAAGEAQPLSRLQWLGGLLAGKGELLPGHDPQGRYRLTRWPQTEREFPRHFRIATAMMKGPATLEEVAEASKSPLADVADFTNANLVTGFAEFVPEPEPEPEAPARPGGFFSRLRGRS